MPNRNHALIIALIALITLAIFVVQTSCGCGDDDDDNDDATNFNYELLDTVYVDKSYTGADADGSIMRPFPTIQVGLGYAAPGATVYVAPAVYPENLTFPSRDNLTLTGWGTKSDDMPTVQGNGEGPAITAGEVNNLTITNIAVEGGKIGIYLSGVKDFNVAHGMIQRNELTGAYALQSQGQFTDNIISENSSLDDGQYGFGVQVSDSSTVSFSENTISGNSSVGVIVDNSSVEMNQNTIADNGASGVQMSGNLDYVKATTLGFTLTGNTITGNGQTGVLIHNASGTMEDNTISDTQSGSDNQYGYGVQLTGNCTLDFVDNMVERNGMTGVNATGGPVVKNAVLYSEPGSITLNMTGNTIRDNEGPGCQFSEMTLGEFSANAVENNKGVGILLHAVQGSLTGSTVTGTGGRLEMARGIQAQGGSNIILDQMDVSDNQDFGVVYTTASTGLIKNGEFSRNGGESRAGGATGDGVSITDRSFNVILTGNSIKDNARAGVLFDGTSGSLSDNEITGNAWGLILQETGEVTNSDDNDIHDNEEDFVDSPDGEVVDPPEDEAPLDEPADIEEPAPPIPDGTTTTTITTTTTAPATTTSTQSPTTTTTTTLTEPSTTTTTTTVTTAPPTTTTSTTTTTEPPTTTTSTTTTTEPPTTTTTTEPPTTTTTTTTTTIAPTTTTTTFVTTTSTTSTTRPDHCEFGVNLHTDDNQEFPDVAINQYGYFVSVWESQGQNSVNYDIIGRLFSVDGSPVGAEFAVNTDNTSDKIQSAVAMTDSGDFVVVWQSEGQDSDGKGIFGQRFLSSGQKEGQEFQVNTYVAGDQIAPDVAMDKFGNYMVVWQSFGQDGDSGGIFAQRYDYNGDMLGSEFQVNTNGADQQDNPAVAMNGSGLSVVVWESRPDGETPYAIVGQKFDDEGNPSEGEFQVASQVSTDQLEPAVAINTDTGFVVTWHSDPDGGAVNNIYARRFGLDGVAAGEEYQVSSYEGVDQDHSAIAMDPSGGILVTWTAQVQDGDGGGIYGRYFDQYDDPFGGEFRINTTTDYSQSCPSVAMDEYGNSVIAWISENQDGDLMGVIGQMYDNDGFPRCPPPTTTTTTSTTTTSTTTTTTPPTTTTTTPPTTTTTTTTTTTSTTTTIIATTTTTTTTFPPGCEIQVNTYTADAQNQPAIAMDDSTGIVVVWASQVAFLDTDIYGRRFGLDGKPEGGEFVVNTYTTAKQGSPSVAMIDGGAFVVVWDSEEQDGDSKGIFEQKFDENGDPDGAEIQVNVTTTLTQSSPDIAMNDDGDRVVVWQDSSGSDGDGYGVFARYAGAGSGYGGEFQVNTYTTSSQASPSAGMDMNGNFVVAWQSNGQDNGNQGIYAQRYDSSANPVGGEFRVNSSNRGAEIQPDVSMDDAGNFTVAWSSSDDGDATGVYAQRYNSLGNPQGGEFLVNSHTDNQQQNTRVVQSPVAGPIVVWQSYEQDGGGFGVYAQRYNSNGSANGSEFRVNTTTVANQYAPVVTVNNYGIFAIAWTSADQDSSDDGVFMQMYYNDQDYICPPATTTTTTLPTTTTTPPTTTTTTITPPTTTTYEPPTTTTTTTTTAPPTTTTTTVATTTTTTSTTHPPGCEILVNTTVANAQEWPAIAMNDSNIVVVWAHEVLTTDDDVYGQRFAMDGTPAGSQFMINTYTSGWQRFPAVAMDDFGAFTVVWESYQQDGDTYGVYGQKYDSAGAADGGEFQVNTETTGYQGLTDVAVNDNGDLVVVWVDNNDLDGDGYGIFGRHASAGGAFGDQFQVNTYTTSDQNAPEVAMDANGNFVVTWKSTGQDFGGVGIYAQRFDATATPAGSEFLVNAAGSSNEDAPDVSMDESGNYTIVWETPSDGDSTGIYGQRYDNTGLALGGGFLINSYTTGVQEDPAVAVSPVGGFVVAWESYNQDGDNWGVFARRYNDAGGPAVPEFRANTTYIDIQSEPAIAMNSNGQYAVAWASVDQDGADEGIYMQIYSATDDYICAP